MGTMENRHEQMGPDRIDITTVLDDLWRAFWRFLWLLVMLALLFGCLSVWRARRSYSPSYQAYASFAVTATGVYTGSYYDSQMAEQVNATFPYILSSGMLSTIVAEDLGLSSIPGTITTEVVENNALVTIYVTSSDPQMAYDILQSVVENYPTVAEYIIGETLLTEIDESGVPTEPTYTPNYRRAAVRGAETGAGLYVVLLLIYVVTKRTVRRKEDLEKRISIDYLGTIPMMKQKKRSRKRSTVLLDQRGASSVLGEGFRNVRTRVVKKCEEGKARSILVTSAAAGEGKTTVASNLALSLAKKGYRVALVDADLRNPSVAEAFGARASKQGIVDVLEGRVEVEDALRSYRETLDILPGTAAVKAPSKLLGSRRMEQLLKALLESHDYVIVDAPPCGILADAAQLARMVDGAIIVVRQDHTRIDRILGAVESIAETGTMLIGYVLNGTSVGITGYGYGYGYGYGKYGYGTGKKAYGYGEKRSSSRSKES